MRRIPGVTRVSSRDITNGPSLIAFLKGLAEIYSKRMQISLACTREKADRRSTTPVAISIVTFEWTSTDAISFRGLVESTVVEGTYNFNTRKGRMSWES